MATLPLPFDRNTDAASVGSLAHVTEEAWATRVLSEDHIPSSCAYKSVEVKRLHNRLSNSDQFVVLEADTELVAVVSDADKPTFDKKAKKPLVEDVSVNWFSFANRKPRRGAVGSHDADALPEHPLNDDVLGASSAGDWLADAINEVVDDFERELRAAGATYTLFDHGVESEDSDGRELAPTPTPPSPRLDHGNDRSAGSSTDGYHQRRKDCLVLYRHVCVPEVLFGPLEIESRPNWSFASVPDRTVFGRICATFAGKTLCSFCSSHKGCKFMLHIGQDLRATEATLVKWLTIGSEVSAAEHAAVAAEIRAEVRASKAG
jgi:hypothetical protein